MTTPLKNATVHCPICSLEIYEKDINAHIDSGCTTKSQVFKQTSSKTKPNPPSSSRPLAPIFSQARTKRLHSSQSSTAVDDYSIMIEDSPPPEVDPPSSRRTLTNPKSIPSISKLKDGPPPAKRVKTSMAGNLRAAAPLAEKLRPITLEDFVGHDHVTGQDSLLRGLLEGGGVGSIILWGPAGCGKTTLARLLASRTNSSLKELSATSSGTAEVRTAFEEAKNALRLTGKRTILFMDEIHRFNKPQQDLFLPYVEQGVVQLVGATTENPSFKLNNALLSRCRVFQLDRLTDDNIRLILQNAIQRVEEFEDLLPPAQRKSVDLPSSSVGPSPNIELSVPSRTFPQVTSRIIDSITSFALGDARTALSLLELVLTAPWKTSEEVLLNSLRKSVVARYDRTGDDRYDMISALHKSLRGSDGNAAMYWLARMLTAGEDPLYVARRLIVVASEDVGLADNHALPLATATYTACTTIGMPECRINLAHCVAYLAEAPKSTRAYEAYARAEAAANADSTLPVPINIRNAPTGLMKDLGYGKEYRYNPDFRHPVTNQFLPSELSDRDFLREAGDLRDKTWDEELLQEWESTENGGLAWTGRVDLRNEDSQDDVNVS